MSRMKDWLLEHEEAFGGALETNPKNLGEILDYMHDQMQVVDVSMVRWLWDEYSHGEIKEEWEGDYECD